MKRFFPLLSLALVSCTLLPSKFLLLSLDGPPGVSVPEVERLDVEVTAHLPEGDKTTTVTFDLAGQALPYSFVLEFQDPKERGVELDIEVFGRSGDQTLVFASSPSRIKNEEVALLAHFCGDGGTDVELNEECDDGNLTNGDGCNANCTLSRCGNGVFDEGEACDDANAIEGDGCDSNCTLSACGNGVVGGDEACDDGNLQNGEGCDQNCTVSACGNAQLDVATEDCDDGNAAEGDGCDSNCTTSRCGNGVVGGAEACDDGNTVEGDGCDSNCTVSACGNGILSPGERCFVLSADTFPVGTAPQDLVSADFNGDGLIDLATANQNSNDVSLLLGLAAASFSPATSISTGAGSLPRSLVAADLDGDSDVDLAVAASGTDRVLLIENAQPAQVFAPGNTQLAVGNEPNAILAVDLTKDGLPELVTANFLSKNLSVLEHNATNNFSYKTQQVLATPGGAAASGPVAVTSGNVDSDNSNSVDLIVPFSFDNPTKSEVSFFANQNPNNGSLSFAPFSQRVPVASAGFNAVSSVVAGDVNEDGRLDVLYNNAGFNQVGLLLGEDQGVFTQLGTTEQLLPLGEVANKLLLEDLNDDGHLDLITLGSSLQVFTGDGTGQFTLSLNLPNLPSFSGALSDFNQDGFLDLAFLRNGSVSLLLSNP